MPTSPRVLGVTRRQRVRGKRALTNKSGTRVMFSCTSVSAEPRTGDPEALAVRCHLNTLASAGQGGKGAQPSHQHLPGAAVKTFPERWGSRGQDSSERGAGCPRASPSPELPRCPARLRQGPAPPAPHPHRLADEPPHPSSRLSV